jgi:hypothetical protein
LRHASARVVHRICAITLGDVRKLIQLIGLVANRVREISRARVEILRPQPSSKDVCKSQQRLVALLGFAYRRISVKFTQNTRKPSQPKPLPTSVKSMADWIQIKLYEQRMAPYHLALKMGIATSIVNAWKDGLARRTGKCGRWWRFWAQIGTAVPMYLPLTSPD